METFQTVYLKSTKQKVSALVVKENAKTVCVQLSDGKVIKRHRVKHAHSNI